MEIIYEHKKYGFPKFPYLNIWIYILSKLKFDFFILYIWKYDGINGNFWSKKGQLWVKKGQILEII